MKTIYNSVICNLNFVILAQVCSISAWINVLFVEISGYYSGSQNYATHAEARTE